MIYYKATHVKRGKYLIVTKELVRLFFGKVELHCVVLDVLST